jgi:hypothetical protein
LSCPFSPPPYKLALTQSRTAMRFRARDLTADTVAPIVANGPPTARTNLRGPPNVSAGSRALLSERELGLFFRETLIFGPETGRIGFVWRAVHAVDAYLESRISHPRPPFPGSRRWAYAGWLCSGQIAGRAFARTPTYRVSET